MVLHNYLTVYIFLIYDTPIYNVNTKRLMTQIKYTFGIVNWGHINEKDISKLHKDEFLDKFDFESYE